MPIKKIIIGLGALLVLLAGIAGYAYWRISSSSSSAEIITPPGALFVANDKTDENIITAYSTIADGVTASQDAQKKALQLFRDVAADEQNTNLQRSMALNGIHYTYMQSTFNAQVMKDVVFSTAPFSQYYVPSASSSSDLVHPNQAGDVAGIEAALGKLDSLSNALAPNHFAIGRMEIAEVFAYERESYGKTAAERAQIKAVHVAKVKSLVKAYVALPMLSSIKTYSTAMRVQMVMVHASALAFLWQATGVTAYRDLSEAQFKQALALSDTSSSPVSASEAVGIKSNELLARIFYAAYFWHYYSANYNRQYIEDVLRPLTDEKAVAGTTVYKVYLPSQKDSKIEPFVTLRTIAAQMPALKTFLQGRGWTF